MQSNAEPYDTLTTRPTIEQLSADMARKSFEKQKMKLFREFALSVVVLANHPNAVPIL